MTHVLDLDAFIAWIVFEKMESMNNLELRNLLMDMKERWENGICHTNGVLWGYSIAGMWIRVSEMNLMDCGDLCVISDMIAYDCVLSDFRRYYHLFI